jgi:hypothetical protein
MPWQPSHAIAAPSPWVTTEGGAAKADETAAVIIAVNVQIIIDRKIFSY